MPQPQGWTFASHKMSSLAPKTETRVILIPTYPIYVQWISRLYNVYIPEYTVDTPLNYGYMSSLIRIISVRHSNFWFEKRRRWPNNQRRLLESKPATCGGLNFFSLERKPTISSGGAEVKMSSSSSQEGPFSKRRVQQHAYFAPDPILRQTPPSAGFVRRYKTPVVRPRSHPTPLILDPSASSSASERSGIIAQQLFDSSRKGPFNAVFSEPGTHVQRVSKGPQDNPQGNAQGSAAAFARTASKVSSWLWCKGTVT